MNNAETALEALLAAMDEMGLSYEKQDEFTYTFAYAGDDLPMYFKIIIDEKRQLTVLLCPQQFTVKPDKILPIAAIVSQINYSLTDGSFDLDVSDGAVVFRLTSSFAGSYISASVLEYMIECAVYTVDEYNDKLYLINEGAMDAREFLKKIGAAEA